MTLHPYTQLDVNAEHCQLQERFAIFLFDKTSDLEHVDEARNELFCQNAKSNCFAEMLTNIRGTNAATLDALMQN